MPGSYSNLWCSLFNADLALSVAMTTASTVVSALMLPLNLLFYLSLIYNESGAQKVLGVCFWCMLICLFCLSGVTRFFPAHLMSTTNMPLPPYHQHGEKQHLDWLALFTSIGVVILGVGAGLTVTQKKKTSFSEACVVFVVLYATTTLRSSLYV